METNGRWVVIPNDSELYHHGILGMKWGVRRYQNRDGTLTSAGKRREARINRRYDRKVDHLVKDRASLSRLSSNLTNRRDIRRANRAIRGVENKIQKTEDKRQEKLSGFSKKDIKNASALSKTYVSERTAQITAKALARVGPITMGISGLKAAKQGKSIKGITTSVLKAGLGTAAIGALAGYRTAKKEVKVAERSFGN